MQVKLNQPVNAKIPKDWVMLTDEYGGMVRFFYGTDAQGVLHVWRTADGTETVCGHKVAGKTPFEEARYCEGCFFISKGDA